MCLRRPSWLEKKGCESFVTVAGGSYLSYALRKAPLRESSWPDVKGTVVTEGMLF